MADLFLDDINFGDETLNGVWRALREACERANRWAVSGAELDEGPGGFALYVRNRPKEPRHAVVMSPGIDPAPDADTLGSGPIMLRTDDGEGNLTDDVEGVLWHNFTIAFETGTRLTVVPYRGDWTLPGADCPPEAEAP
jgi:hypothetical protein